MTVVLQWAGRVVWTLRTPQGRWDQRSWWTAPRSALGLAGTAAVFLLRGSAIGLLPGLARDPLCHGAPHLLLAGWSLPILDICPLDLHSGLAGLRHFQLPQERGPGPLPELPEPLLSLVTLSPGLPPCRALGVGSPHRRQAEPALPAPERRTFLALMLMTTKGTHARLHPRSQEKSPLSLMGPPPLETISTERPTFHMCSLIPTYLTVC